MTRKRDDLNIRSLEVFKELVDAYIETGEPVGSRTLSKRLSTKLSPATIRNVMADLEEMNFLYSPHTSAGRVPTDHGLNFFIHGLLEINDIETADRTFIEKLSRGKGRNPEAVIEEATRMLSGLSQCAGLVLAPKIEAPLKDIQFVPLSEGRVLLILISQQGAVENRILDLPNDVPMHTLQEAANYLSHHMRGKTLSSARETIALEMSKHKKDLDALTSRIVEQGLAVWSGGAEQNSSLIVKGQSQLLKRMNAQEDLARIQDLFTLLEEKENFAHLLDASIQADGVQIFIGSENQLFQMAGCSVVISPYKNAQNKVLGTIGVIGPTRMNYRRVIPLVDYTAKIVSKLLS